MSGWATMLTWPARRWLVAVGAGVGTALLIGLPTDVIPNPVFGRPVPVTWWSYPVLVVTAVLAGLVVATYVRDPAAPGPVAPGLVDEGLVDEGLVDEGLVDDGDPEPVSRTASVGGLLSFFAVGCPVCNKIVLVALGTTGARQWFEPVQPLLAVASIVLLAWALRGRLRSAAACPLPRTGPMVDTPEKTTADRATTTPTSITTR
ncbi:MAG: hypothetical protein RLZZ362_85 [Actinomycetota bacterium]|jgi:hypothetical protein